MMVGLPHLTRPLGPPCNLRLMAASGILVSEVARRAGTTRKALRLYEAAGLITPDRRTEAGYRVYGAQVIPLLSFILKARRAGFTVAEPGTSSACAARAERHATTSGP